MHRVFIEHAPAVGGVLTIAGDEARHAVRVRRLDAGDRLELLDGRGGVSTGVIASVGKDGRTGEWQVVVRVEAARRVEPPTPRVEVWCPAPEGDRARGMIDQLSQVGAASWTPLVSARCGPHAAGARVERLARIAVESAKQCGRAWLLSIEPGGPRPLAEALRADAGRAVIVCDASGGAPMIAGAGAVRVVVGPEGGFAPAELELARASGVQLAGLGPHALRTETAAVVAAVLALNAWTPTQRSNA